MRLIYLLSHASRDAYWTNCRGASKRVDVIMENCAKILQTKYFYVYRYFDMFCLMQMQGLNPQSNITYSGIECMDKSR